MSIKDFLRKNRIYNPNAPKTPITLRTVFTVVLLSIGFLWFIGKLLGLFEIPPIGILLLVGLILITLVAVFSMVYKETLGNRDFLLIGVLVLLIVLVLLFGKTYMPELYSVAIGNIQSVLP